jgi:hypothetical protein
MRKGTKLRSTWLVTTKGLTRQRSGEPSPIRRKENCVEDTGK